MALIHAITDSLLTILGGIIGGFVAIFVLFLPSLFFEWFWKLARRDPKTPSSGLSALTQWELPNYAEHGEPQAIRLRRASDAYRLDAVLEWPMPLRDLFWIAAGLILLAVWLASVVLLPGMYGTLWDRWRAEPVNAVFAALGLGCFALAWRGVRQWVKRRHLRPPFLWLPEEQLRGGSQTSVMFRRSLNTGHQLARPVRLDARLLCLEITDLSADQIDPLFGQRVLYQLDLPCLEVTQGVQTVEGRWTLDLPSDAMTSRLSAWPRILWMMQVREHLPGLAPTDVTFMLPVESAAPLSQYSARHALVIN